MERGGDVGELFFEMFCVCCCGDGVVNELVVNWLIVFIVIFCGLVFFSFVIYCRFFWLFFSLGVFVVFLVIFCSLLNVIVLEKL